MITRDNAKCVLVVIQLSWSSRDSETWRLARACWGVRTGLRKRALGSCSLAQHQLLLVSHCFETKPRRPGTCKGISNAAPEPLWVGVSLTCDAPNTCSLILHVLASWLGACRQHLQLKAMRSPSCAQSRPSPCRPRGCFQTAPFPKSCDCRKDLDF